MPLLGALLSGLFGWLASFLVQLIGRKIGLATAYVAALGTVVAAVLALLGTVVAPLLSSLYQGPMFGWVGLAFPPVAGTCMAALAAVWSGCTLYAWQRDSLKIAASV